VPGRKKKEYIRQLKTYPIPVIKNGYDLQCNKNGCDQWGFDNLK